MALPKASMRELYAENSISAARLALCIVLSLSLSQIALVGDLALHHANHLLVVVGLQLDHALHHGC
jgi:hypothetical protein